ASDRSGRHLELHVQGRVIPRMQEDRRAVEADGVRCAARRRCRDLERDRHSAEIADFQFEARIEIVEQLRESEREAVAVPASAIAALAVAVLAVAVLAVAVLAVVLAVAALAVAAFDERHGLGAGGADGLHQPGSRGWRACRSQGPPWRKPSGSAHRKSIRPGTGSPRREYRLRTADSPRRC